MNTNVVVLEGGLTRDPEIRQAGKSQVASFGIACSRSVPDGNGGWKDASPAYFDIQAWTWLAERVMSLSKGDQVIVVGELRFETWEKDGQRRNTVRVTASAVGRQLPKNEAGQQAVSEDDIPF